MTTTTTTTTTAAKRMTLQESLEDWAKKATDTELLQWHKKWWMTDARTRRNWSNSTREQLLLATWELQRRKLA